MCIQSKNVHTQKDTRRKVLTTQFDKSVCLSHEAGPLCFHPLVSYH